MSYKNETQVPVDSKSKKCILCRKEILKGQAFLIKDTTDIKKWNDQSINSLCEILFKSKEDADAEKLKILLRNGSYCINCRRCVWDIDITLRMIIRLESKLEKLTQNIISELLENHEKSKTNIHNELSSYDKTVQDIFNALDAVEVQVVSSTSRKHTSQEKHPTTAKDYDHADISMPPYPKDFEDSSVKEEIDKEQLDKEDSDEDFVLYSEEQCMIDDDNDNTETENGNDDERSKTEDLEINKNELKTAKKPTLTKRTRRIENDNETETKKQPIKQKKTIEINPERNVKCKETGCERLFKDDICMEAHIRKKHLGLNPYYCNQCNKAFTKLPNLRNHLMRHEGELKFKCPHSNCTKVFKIAFDMKRHIQNIHTSKVVKYETSHNKNTLNHPKDEKLNKHKCKLCDKQYVQLMDLKNHEQMHSGIKFKCAFCEEMFSTPWLLKKHRVTHLFPEREFKCYFCGKQYPDAFELRTHIHSHTGERPFKCKLCHQRLTRASDLKRHEKSHSGIKTEICSICGKTFARRSYLINHEKSHYKNTEASNLLNQ